MLFATLAWACTPIEKVQEHAQELTVRVDAEPEVIAELDDVELTVESRRPDANSWTLEKSNRFTPVPGVAEDWPLTVKLAKYDPRATYLATATARDQAQSILIQARAVADPNALEDRLIKLRLDRDCLRRSSLCPRAQTCMLSECVDAREPLRERTTEGEHEPVNTATGEIEETPAIESDCMERGAGERFCDADGKMLECQADKTALVRPCDDNEQCLASGADVRCGCRTGFVADRRGCIEATDCRDRGGCDLLTECQLQNGERTCTACPRGFSGSGELGCTPVLRALSLSRGVLDPPFDPETTSYRVKLSMLTQRITLTAQSEGDVSLSINGMPVELEMPWTSPVISPGESKLRVTLSAGTGARRDYEITVEQTQPTQDYLKPSNGRAGDWFGAFVAADGDTIVVGAPHEPGGSQQLDAAAARVAGAGAAYVYVREGDSWVQQGYLKADQPSVEALFGASVAISGDRIAVGAPGNFPAAFTSGTTEGAVYVFERTQGAWTLQHKLTSGSSRDSMGFRVALLDDTLVASAPFDSARAALGGAVYVYGWNGSAWGERQRLTAPTTMAQGQFGGSLAIDSDTLAVGAWLEDVDELMRAGAVYVYTRGNEGWSFLQRVVSPTPRALALFGTGLAVLGDRLVVGAPNNPADKPSTFSGEAHAFKRDGAEYRVLERLEATNPRVGDRFGQHVSLRAEKLAVSAPGDSSASVMATGEQLMSSGAVYLYAANDQDYVRSGFAKASKPDQGDSFGNAIALTDDYLVSCAVYEDSAAREINGDATDNSQEDMGAAYVLQ